MTDKCVACGRFIPTDQIFCNKCIDRQRKNKKLQELLKSAKPLR